LTDHGRMVELPLYSAVNVEFVRNVLKNEKRARPESSAVPPGGRNRIRDEISDLAYRL
jgi:hypothetical protein